MANFQFNRTRKLWLSDMNWLTDTFYMMFVTSAYVEDPDDNFVADVVAAECTGANYARKIIVNPSVVQNDADNRGEAHCDDLEWLNLTLTAPAAAAIVYKFVTNDADSILVGHVDTPSFPIDVTGVDVTYKVPSTGLLRL